MKSNPIIYYVEGETEEKLVKSLKNKYIKSGKIVKLNLVNKKIAPFNLRTIPKNTIIVIIVDVDTDNFTTLDFNLKVLKKSKIKSPVLILQIENLEDELIHSTNIKDIKRLLNSESTTDFKRDIIKESNLLSKLEEKKFDINKIWCREATNSFKKYENKSHFIKIKT